MKKRVFNILLCVVMVVGLMPTSFAASTQTTSTDTATKKTVMLGSNSPLGYDSTTKTYDKLYFGTYYASEDDATATPYEWRILD